VGMCKREQMPGIKGLLRCFDDSLASPGLRNWTAACNDKPKFWIRYLQHGRNRMQLV
jgi:hypothetical protein